MDPEITEHVRRARGGDLDAFCYVATALREPALRMASSILGDRHAAEDAAQDAFLLAFDRLGELREPEAFGGWLRTLVRTAALRVARRRREATFGEPPEAPAPDPEPVLDRLETRAEIRAAIAALSPKGRDVIERYYLDGLSVAETAEALGLPPGTVKRRLHEARERLRPRLLGLTGLSEPTRPTPSPSTRLRLPL